VGEYLLIIAEQPSPVISGTVAPRLFSSLRRGIAGMKLSSQEQDPRRNLFTVEEKQANVGSLTGNPMAGWSRLVIVRAQLAYYCRIW